MKLDEEVAYLTREYAKGWLEEEGLCTCAGQVQILCRRMAPFAQATAEVMRRWPSPLTGMVLAEYIGAAWNVLRVEWMRGLHKPGASAGPGTPEERAARGVGPHC